MKKLLIAIISLILLLGVGFVYLVKNPELPIAQKVLTLVGMDKPIDRSMCTSYFDGCNTCTVQNGEIGECTKMFCETPTKPKCLEYVWTGMDLNNCISYFDGCNNCSVENGRPSACTLMYCETPGEPKCNEYVTGITAPNTVGLNPASDNCQKKGGTLKIVQGTNGEIGMCELANGTVCEERAYMDGSCGGDTKTTNTTPKTRTTSSRIITPKETSLPKNNLPQGTTNIQNPTISENTTSQTTSTKGSTTQTITSSGGSSSTNVGTTPNNTVCTMDYVPVCAILTSQCTNAPCPTSEQTFGNTCMMNTNTRARFLHKGECIAK